MSYKLSVIIATLDEGDPYRVTLSSCLKQQGIDIEVVVFVKDTSYSLASPFLKKQMIDDVRVTTIRGDDRGIADAWNTATQYATGGHLCFLGAGDYFYSATSVSEIFALATKFERINNVFFGKQVVRMSAVELRPWTDRKSFDATSLTSGMTIPHASSFWPRSLWLNRTFDRTFKIALDYEFALRVKNLVEFSSFDVIVAVIEPGGLSNSPGRMLQVIAEDIRARTVNGLPANKYTVLNLKRALRWFLGRFA